jgi:beta-mannanase
MRAVRCDLVSIYWSWGLGWSTEPFEIITTILRSGRRPLVTWEPWRLPPPDAGEDLWPGNADYTLRRIAAGAFDDYIRRWAHALAEMPGRLLLRPTHEMNGNWYPWGGSVNGNRPEEFAAAWRHLHEMFTREGATNVEWVWCPYAHSVPDRADNALERYYPGARWVDWLALDGYNWGDARPWARWQGCAAVFGDAYRRIVALGPQPVLIAEVGCAESGGDKPAWIREACAWLASASTRVAAVVWFNVDKECDWRITSSPDSLRAFREAWPREAASAAA